MLFRSELQDLASYGASQKPSDTPSITARVSSYNDVRMSKSFQMPEMAITTESRDAISGFMGPRRKDKFGEGMVRRVATSDQDVKPSRMKQAHLLPRNRQQAVSLVNGAAAVADQAAAYKQSHGP